MAETLSRHRRPEGQRGNLGTGERRAEGKPRHRRPEGLTGNLGTEDREET